jgi:hypothetical protein
MRGVELNDIQVDAFVFTLIISFDIALSVLPKLDQPTLHERS